MKKIGFLTLRAQPLHSGHIAIINKALEQCDRLVLLVGSVNRSISYRNPWTFQERRQSIWVTFPQQVADGRIKVYPLNDYRYSDVQWLADVNGIMQKEAQTENHPMLILFGHQKPGNDYLSLFRGSILYQNLESGIDICASEIRLNMYTDGQLPEAAQADKKYFIGEKKRFADYPFPETLNFNCSDAIVECNGHIALIQRARAPGLGAWAMPGGFKEQRETFLDCAIRELMEEVNLRVPEKVLRGSIVKFQMFDDPYRGQGLPRNTMAYHFKIEPNKDGSLPEIRPADDALHCEWVPINQVMNDISMHDDHQDIISTLLNVMPIPAHQNPRYF